jgi:tryptophan halogenase
LFKQASSLQIMLGQGLIPEDHNVLADDISDEQLKLFLSNVEGVASRAVMPLPSHSSFIEQNCKASR